MVKPSTCLKAATLYVEEHGDTAQVIRRLYPAYAVKKDSTCHARFSKDFDHERDFWKRVAELQTRRDEMVALNAAQVMNQWAMIALADASKLTQVRAIACPACYEEAPDNASPNPACPRCGGEGKRDVVLTPTDKLARSERLLFAGAKVTRNGIEIKLRNQDEALANIARALGMFTERVQVANTPQQLPLPAPLPSDPNEAAKAYAAFIKGV